MDAPPNKTMHAPPNKTTHSSPNKTTHTHPGATTHPPGSNHAHPPPEQPHMPPQSNHACPPEQPHMPPWNNHACPPRATTHAPPQQPRTPPVNRMTNWYKNITLLQTSFAGGNNNSTMVNITGADEDILSVTNTDIFKSIDESLIDHNLEDFGPNFITQSLEPVPPDISTIPNSLFLKPVMSCVCVLCPVSVFCVLHYVMHQC